MIPAVILPLLLLTMNAAAGTEQPAEFLGFTWYDVQYMALIGLGVAAIAFLAFFTSRDKQGKKPGMQGPMVRKHHHQHHRVHRIRR